MAAPASGASLPTAAFAATPLPLVSVSLPNFHHIFSSRYPDPLGYGKNPSRFSDPRRRVAKNRFGVYYLAETPEAAFVEAVLRENAIGTTGTYIIPKTTLAALKLADIRATSPLNLVDLRGCAKVRLRVPTDATSASNHRLGQHWSLGFHDNPSRPDGILYDSRLVGRANIAVYDRAMHKLAVNDVTDLLDSADLIAILTKYDIGMV